MTCPNCGLPHPDSCNFCLRCGSRLDGKPSPAPQAAAVPPQPEAAPELPLFERAYKSYLSTDPEEHRFFEEMAGSDELKAAYEEECAKNKAAIQSGQPVAHESSYLDFMGVLCTAFAAAPAEEPAPAEELAPVEESAPVEEAVSEEEPAAEEEVASEEEPAAEEVQPPEAPVFVEPAPETGKKKSSKAKTLIPIILLALLLIAALVLNVLQYLQGQDSAGVIASQETEIESLNSTIAEHEKTITNQKSTIASQKSEISDLKVTKDYYDTICQELSSGNVGYAASNFHVDDSVIVMDKDEINRKFTLTAHWPGGGTVSIDQSGYAAYVSYDQNSWDTSTQMTIEPCEEGVTIVTFSNDQDSNTFKMLIIVTD